MARIFKWLKSFGRKSETEIECEHDFDRSEKVTDYCDVCGEWVRKLITYKCRKCGYEEFEDQDNGLHVCISAGYPGGVTELANLCWKCYKKYIALIKEVKAYLDEKSVGVEMSVPDAEVIRLHLTIDWRQRFEDLLKHFEYISKPVASNTDGITFYAFPKSPLVHPYEMRILPRELVEYLKATSKWREREAENE